MCPHARRRWSGLPSLLPLAAARRRFERLRSTRSSDAMFKSGQRSASQAQWSRLQHWVDTVEKVGATLPTRNNRIAQAGFLNRSCAFAARLESILLEDPLKIFFRQYRPTRDNLAKRSCRWPLGPIAASAGPTPLANAGHWRTTSLSNCHNAKPCGAHLATPHLKRPPATSRPLRLAHSRLDPK